MNDKRGILQQLATMERVVIELGCGSARQVKEAIGIDQIDYDSVDIVCNLEEGLPFLPDNSVDIIYSFHLLEHLPDLGFFMSEIFRVLKPGGKTIGTVPHFSNPYYYSDYTHKTPFGLYTFCYFAPQTPYQRKVLLYQKDIRFKINSQEIIFYSPFILINIFRKLYGIIFNAGIFMQEFYEGSLSKILPAHEISFELEKK
ncbi:MAG: class I SAM-dependent methyltransferase [Bacteroidetes bacterium]|nr:class I SAM-dependent methyltransferase [Bacteroidota bacterium]